MNAIFESASHHSWTVDYLDQVMDDVDSKDRETTKWWAVQCPNATENHIRKGMTCTHDAVRFRSKMIACTRFPWLIVEMCEEYDGTVYARELLIGLLGGQNDTLQYF